MSTAWAYEQSKDKYFIFQVALNMGWLEHKVQVKYYKETKQWSVEPYEADCFCSSLIDPKDWKEDIDKLRPTTANLVD